MTRNETLEKIKNLEKGEDMIIHYVDLQFIVTNDFGEYMIETKGQLYDTTEGVETPIDVMEFIYGEYIEGCANNDKE